MSTHAGIKTSVWLSFSLLVHHIFSNLQSLQQHLSEKEKRSYSNGNTTCSNDYGYSEQSEKNKVDHRDGDTTVQNEDRTRDVNVTFLNKNILLIYFFTPLPLNTTTQSFILIIKSIKLKLLWNYAPSYIE